MLLTSARPVVLITGISASGKTTVAELLARRFERGVHVKGDVFRRMIVAGRQEMTSEPTEEAWGQLRLRYSLGAHTADAYHDAGFAVVVQDVVIGRVLGEYLSAIRSRPLVLVVLAPSPDVVATPNRHDPRLPTGPASTTSPRSITGSTATLPASDCGSTRRIRTRSRPLMRSSSVDSTTA